MINLYYSRLKDKIGKQIKYLEHSKSTEPILELNQYNELIKKAKMLYNFY